MTRPGRLSGTRTSWCSAGTGSTWPRSRPGWPSAACRHLLCEGGPHLLRDLLDQGALDELDKTLVPRLVGGLHPRITDGPPVDVPLELRLLVEEDHTLLGRWFVAS